MWKSGTFALEDINKKLIDDIVFFDISYPAMGDPGAVIFLTQKGDEYIISQSGTEWRLEEIVELFSDISKVYCNYENGVKDEFGFRNIGEWKIIPEFAGIFFVRNDYFEKFYKIYQSEIGCNKEFPLQAARIFFGRENCSGEERMVYVKTQECWDKELQEARDKEQEVALNRLSETDVPWIKYRSVISEGYIRFWVRQNENGTLSGFRWLIQVQKEQYQEGGYRLDAPVECYNLFLQRYENIQVKQKNEIEDCFYEFIKNNKAGEFVRSYKDLEKAKDAVSIRNEWLGWGNVNKKNVYLLNYEYLKTQIEGDSQIYIY